MLNDSMVHIESNAWLCIGLHLSLFLIKLIDFAFFHRYYIITFFSTQVDIK